MKSIQHMNAMVTCFPAPIMMRIKPGGNSDLWAMFQKAIRKRNRIEFFKRQQRRKERGK